MARVALTGLGLLLAVAGGILAANRGGKALPLAVFSSGTAARPWFRDVADRCGIDFRHVSGSELHGKPDSVAAEPMLYFPEIMVGGLCLLDFDRDGKLDVYFVQGGRVVGPRAGLPGDQLYRNLGGGRFEDVTSTARVGDPGYGMGCTCGDFDNDGWTDIYVLNVGPNVLYRNNGDGTFADVTQAAGVGDPSFSSSAAFFDFDRDGDQDLFVVNYVVWSPATEILCGTLTDLPGYCGPQHYNAPAKDILYRNNGDGMFTDISAPSGIVDTIGNGLGVVPADLNNDGWMDLCVANDLSPNQLWLNQGNGTFRDAAVTMSIAYNGEGHAEAGMGIDAQDVDDDLDLDVVMTKFTGETTTLHVNERGYFEDRSLQAGFAVSRPFTGFGTALADFNNDGVLDLYVANGKVGIVQGAYYSQEDPFAEPNLVYQGLGGRKFKEVTPRGGTAELLVHTSRGAAFGDYDDDGDVDVFVVNKDARPYVLENLVGGKNHWIAFHVLHSNGVIALGARVKITVAGVQRIRDVRVAYSYCASNDPRVHFGLGQASKVDDVTVYWPDGAVQTFGSHAADQIVELRRLSQTQ